MRTMLLGHFGSGKTEVAIACALELAAGGERPLLLDLDVITPYFRSRDPARRLGELGVEVVAPADEWSAADLPLISGRTLTCLRSEPARSAVLDVGGDAGAKVIASLAHYLQPGSLRALVVVNPCRPNTRTVKQVIDTVRWAERLARVQITGLVNNANLGAETSVQTVRDGLQVVQAAASELGIPVAFTACRAELAAPLRAAGLTVLPLPLFMRPPWEDLP